MQDMHHAVLQYGELTENIETLKHHGPLPSVSIFMFVMSTRSAEVLCSNIYLLFSKLRFYEMHQALEMQIVLVLINEWF